MLSNLSSPRSRWSSSIRSSLAMTSRSKSMMNVSTVGRGSTSNVGRTPMLVQDSYVFSRTEALVT